MVEPIWRVDNDPRWGGSTVSSGFTHSQPPKGSQSLFDGLAPYEGTIGSGINDTGVDSYSTQLPLGQNQTSPIGVANEGVGFYPDINGPIPDQRPGIYPVEYERLFSAVLGSPLTENHDQIHDMGDLPDMPQLDDECPGFGATVQQEYSGTPGIPFNYGVSSEEFAERMVPFSIFRDSLGAIAQPQLGNGSLYSSQDIWALHISISRDDAGDSIPPTPFRFSDGYPVETLPRCESPRMIVASNPKLRHRTRSTPVPTQVANKAKDQEKDRQGPMIQTLDSNMDPTEPRKRRCFSKSEKEQINR
ncbi:hypothetical protein MMC29_008263, partial [Sticta canariensis]|nr:hypothetical protein [Sticta canariensis]